MERDERIGAELIWMVIWMGSERVRTRRGGAMQCETGKTEWRCPLGVSGANQMESMYVFVADRRDAGEWGWAGQSAATRSESKILTECKSVRVVV